MYLINLICVEPYKKSSTRSRT